MARTVTVAAAQLGPADEAKAGNLKRIGDLIQTAAERGAQIVCLPELALTPYFCGRNLRDFEGYFDPIPGESVDRVAEAAARHRVAVVLGLGERAGPAFVPVRGDPMRPAPRTTKKPIVLELLSPLSH